MENKENVEIHIENGEEFTAFLKERGNKLIAYYEKHIDNSEKRLKKIREVAFKYDLPIKEYEKKIRVIDQYLEICNAILQEEIGSYASFKGEFDSVLWTFNERIKQIKNEKKSLKGCKRIILGTIDKLRKQEEDNKKSIGNNTNILERKGFDSGFSDERRFEHLHQSGLGGNLLDSKTNKLKVKQIALIHVYEGIQITRANAKKIASEHGYNSTNSGEGLFQDYTNYCSTANRKGKPTPCTHKKLKNKIELFESIVNHLSDNNKKRAIDEINILKTIIETEYQQML